MKVAFDKQFKAVNSYNLAQKVQAKEIENAELPQTAISPETCRVYFTGKTCIISDKEFKVLKEKVQKLCHEYEDEADLSTLDSKLTKDNIKFIISLLNKEDFPKHEILPIACRTNKNNISIAKTISFDPLFPKYLVAKTLRYTKPENLSFAKALCNCKDFPKTLIPKILEQTYNGSEDYGAKEISGIPYIGKMYQQCVLAPHKYLNINTQKESLSHQVGLINLFFTDYAKEIVKLASLKDSELNDILLRKRFSDMNLYLKTINSLSQKHFNLLQEGLKCKNVKGNNLTPPEKVELIDIINAYKLSLQDFQNLKDMIKIGEIDTKKLKTGLTHDLFKNLSNRNKGTKISEEKLNLWDIKYTHLLIPQLESKNKNQLSELLMLANREENFKDLLTKADTKITRINKDVIKSFRRNNLNYDKWLNPPKEIETRIVSKDKNLFYLEQLSTKLESNINELMNSPIKTFLNKKYSKYITNEGLKLPKELTENPHKLLQFMKNFQSELTPVWNRAQINLQNEKNILQAKQTLTIKDHIETLIETLENSNLQHLTKQQTKNIDLTIKMWDRLPQHDLFQGNYSTCCIGMNRGNGEAMATYLTNTTFNMIELVDNTTGETVGNALCYYLTDGYKPSLVIDNIEINNHYLPSEKFCKEIRDGIVTYAQKLNKEVTGTADTKIYLGRQNNDVPTTDLQAKSKGYSSFIGKLFTEEDDQVYLDALSGWNYGSEINNGTPIDKLYELN